MQANSTNYTDKHKKENTLQSHSWLFIATNAEFRPHYSNTTSIIIVFFSHSVWTIRSLRCTEPSYSMRQKVFHSQLKEHFNNKSSAPFFSQPKSQFQVLNMKFQVFAFREIHSRKKNNKNLNEIDSFYSTIFA